MSKPLVVRAARAMMNPTPAVPDVTPAPKMSGDVQALRADIQKTFAVMQLKGFLKELWELVITKMPFDRFTLRDVYERKGPIVELRPHVKEIEASIRAGLEKLRDRRLLEFVDNRGTYRRLA